MTELRKNIVEGYQAVRLVDVFVLAPVMVYASMNKSLPKGVRAILFVSGVATAVFNGRNYLRIKKAQRNEGL